jgi:hypothetical protein
MAPSALQKVLVGTANLEAVIQTGSIPTLCGKNVQGHRTIADSI